MELCPIDLVTSPWVYTHLWASSLCLFVPDPWTNKMVCEKRTDSTKKDLEQMFRCTQSHFLSPALDFFFLFLFFSDGCWVVCAVFVEARWSGLLHRRWKVFQAVDTAQTNQKTACAVGLGFSLYFFLFMPYGLVVFLSGCLPLCKLSPDNQKNNHLGPSCSSVPPQSHLWSLSICGQI